MSSPTATVTVASRYPYVSRTLIRPRKDTFAAGAFRVYLDGQVVGMLPAMEAGPLSVPPGRHDLYVRFRWYKSQRLPFEANAGDSIVFVTAIPRSGPSFLRLLFRPHKAIELLRDTSNPD